MNKGKILVPLTEAQRGKIKKKFRINCDHIEIEREQLPNIVKYISPQICIDFDDAQEAIIQKAFPDKECDYMLVTKSNFSTFVMKYYAAPLCANE
jgi:hypothetical protein